MKKSIFKIAFLFLGLFLFTSVANAQSCCSKELANCPKKGTPECPIVKACAKKGTADCPLVEQNNLTASKELKSCPLAGTPECPLIKNCTKKGTADCPYAKENNKTAKATTASDKNLPECCRKKG